MVVLLSKFDGKAPFNWNSITLNAVVSILSLAIKTSLVFVIAECIAQWKWILFARGPRLLVDFDRIDSATRGPLGSIKVLFGTKGALVVQFGAILTLLALILDPFTQQLVQLQQSVLFAPKAFGEPGLSALASRTSVYSVGSSSSVKLGDLYFRTTELPLSMQASILNGFSRSPWETAKEALAQCPTSNCTWDQFATLGVCYRCEDLSSKLKRVSGFGDTLLTMHDLKRRTENFSATAFSLPNGHFIANVDGCPLHDYLQNRCFTKNLEGINQDKRYALTSFGTGNPNKTNSMKDIDTLIWSMSFIYPDVKYLNNASLDTESFGDLDKRLYWPNIPMQAEECSLYYCIKMVDSEVQGNQLFENITEADGWIRDPESWKRSDDYELPKMNTPPDDEVDSLEFNVWYSAAQYSDLKLKGPGNLSTEPMTVSADTVMALSHHLQDLFLGNWTNTTVIRKSIQETLGKGAVGFNGVLHGPNGKELTTEAVPPGIRGLWTWTSTNITRRFDALATSMTNEMRRNPNPRLDNVEGQDQDRYEGKLSFEGNVGTEKVLYDIQWLWVTPHGVMLICVLILLIMTAKSAGDPDLTPLARNSTLATIRQGHRIGGVLEDADTMELMEKTARRSYVKISNGKEDEGITRRRMRGEATRAASDQGESQHLTSIEMESSSQK
ncbi:hypothetical protein LCI18_011312 [Fusarium solani-melongenae]|uniref:Uncharacterized protein n=1 Tax=Fusarium solani subsp. cucurbitae TaxID=2747967 RepID=A0ACD3ZHF6_FUSSC|nr:hypothetical protein LCI18_011312 [Fusarium solani-melongenae]